VTKKEVEQFKENIKLLHKEYKASGPGADSTSLEKGLESLQEYKAVVSELNARREELVKAEKLFNLPISSFPELVAIEEENKVLSVLYDCYK
jgi:dynein heavy chain